jgi:bifunctional UDP-N-acetylglucosamine pyrophosphorylase/glucosamine-1-phosphate N-acetyltransferase
MEGITGKVDAAALILAAGKGKRMKSDLAKVLHRLGGRPLVHYVVEAAKEAGISRITVVVGHQANKVREALKGQGLEFVKQPELLGTGHAVLQAKEALEGYHGNLLILYGDVPLLRAETIVSLLSKHHKTGASCTMLTTEVDDPAGYGRIIRDAEGYVARIMEEKDASSQEKAIHEINPGIYCFKVDDLFSCLEHVRNDNAQREYYLTDAIAILRSEGKRVAAIKVKDSKEVMGINTHEELAMAEEVLKASEVRIREQVIK